MIDLTNYAECIGLAFQIVDDLLDVEGDESVTGKRSGKDKELEKCTFPSIYGYTESLNRLDELTNRAIEILSPYYEEADFFISLAKDLAKRVK